MDYKQYKGVMGSSRYVYLPKIGEEATFTISTITEVKSGDPKYHYSRNEFIEMEDGTRGTVARNLGYHHQMGLNDGRILSINNFSAFRRIFMQNDIQEGDTIHIKHIDKGQWEVTKSEPTIEV